MLIELPFAPAIADWRMRNAARALAYSDARMAERAAAAEAAGRTDYKPRHWYPNEDVRKLAKEREKAERESVKRATGVRPYTFHDNDEARLAAKKESNRLASKRKRDKKKAAAAALSNSDRAHDFMRAGNISL